MGPVFVTDLGISFETDPDFKLGGRLGLSFGPRVLEQRVLSIDSDFSYTNSNPGLFELNAVLKVLQLQLAEANVKIYTDFEVFFHAEMGWCYSEAYGFSHRCPDAAAIREGRGSSQQVALKASVDGWNIPNKNFGIEGKGGLWVWDKARVDATVRVTSLGAAACFNIGPFEPGFRYTWVAPPWQLFGDSQFEPGGCDMSKWIAKGLVRAVPGQPMLFARETYRAVASTMAQTYPVTSDQRALAIALKGDGAPPEVVLTGPQGERFETAANPSLDGLTDRYFIFRNPDDFTTYIVVTNPSPGDWKLELKPGSAPLLETSSAEGLPEPKVQATVTGTGTQRTLSWSGVQQIPGQTVTFVARHNDSTEVLGIADAPQGSLTFRPALGPAGKRTVFALVEQDGLLREEVEVASFDAPPPPAIPKPSKLKVKRVEGGIEASWGKVTRVGVKRYEVVVDAGDGRRLFAATEPGQTSARFDLHPPTVPS